MEIRLVRKEDLKALKNVLDTSGLFPAEYLDEMISDYFTNEESQDIWFTSILENKPVSLGYCAPEKLTEGTYNLYAIAVDKDLQGRKIGQEMLGFIESHLKKLGNRLLIVDTSGDADYELTRKFYMKNNYNQEAVIRDFWKEGEDKIVFWKKL